MLVAASWKLCNMVKPLDDKDEFSNLPSREELADVISNLKFAIEFGPDCKGHYSSVLRTCERLYKEHYGEVPE